MSNERLCKITEQDICELQDSLQRVEEISYLFMRIETCERNFTDCIKMLKRQLDNLSKDFLDVTTEHELLELQKMKNLLNFTIKMLEDRRKEIHDKYWGENQPDGLRIKMMTIWSMINI